MIRRAAIGCVCALSLAAPGAASAEGARRTFACTVSLACDGDGVCTEAGGSLDFTLSPQDVDLNGAGRFRMDLDGAEVAAEMTADFTLTWARGAAIFNQLIFTGSDAALWVRREPGVPGTALIRYLTCESTL